MRRVIYESVSAEPRAARAAPDILRGARPFNGLNGLTGLLCACGNRFLQVVEGPEESVALAMRRIAGDPRHHSVQVLLDEKVEGRAFADWAMAYRERGQPAEALEEHVRLLVAAAPGAIAERFQAFARG